MISFWPTNWRGMIFDRNTGIIQKAPLEAFHPFRRSSTHIPIIGVSPVRWLIGLSACPARDVPFFDSWFLFFSIRLKQSLFRISSHEFQKFLNRIIGIFFRSAPGLSEIFLPLIQSARSFFSLLLGAENRKIFFVLLFSLQWFYVFQFSRFLFFYRLYLGIFCIPVSAGQVMASSRFRLSCILSGDARNDRREPSP